MTPNQVELRKMRRCIAEAVAVERPKTSDELYRASPHGLELHTANGSQPLQLIVIANICRYMSYLIKML
jgi:hypothetical protein